MCRERSLISRHRCHLPICPVYPDFGVLQLRDEWRTRLALAKKSCPNTRKNMDTSDISRYGPVHIAWYTCDYIFTNLSSTPRGNILIHPPLSFLATSLPVRLSCLLQNTGLKKHDGTRLLWIPMTCSVGQVCRRPGSMCITNGNNICYVCFPSNDLAAYSLK